MKRQHISIGTVLLILVLIVAFELLRDNGTIPNAPAANEPAAPAPTASAAKQAAPGNTAGGGVTYDPALAKYLPDPRRTPGDTLDVTAQDFCVSGYSSKVRNVTEGEKNRVYAEYGIASHAPGQYEVDHLISLELGGSNSIKNLWPQSYSGKWNAHQKDALEDRLHARVCNGSLDMKTAQQAIATNWIAAYEKYVK